MPAPVTSFYLVTPPSDEIQSMNSQIKVEVYTTLVEAQTASVKAALISGKYRVVCQSISYANPTPLTASVNAQTTPLV